MNKPKLLLLHGAIGQAGELNQLKEHLAESFECHALNFTGHGPAEEESQAFNMDVLVHDLKQFLTVHGFDHYIFGYSMGGFVALKYCIDHEDQLPLGIVTYATKFDWTEVIRSKFISRLNPTDVQTKGGLFLDKLLSRYGGKWHYLLRQTAQLIDNMPKHKIDPIDLDDISIPIMIGVGDEDKLVTIDETKLMTKFLTPESFYICSESGHELEKTQLVNLKQEICKIISIQLRQ
jgi:esterase/lipase